MPPLGDEEEYSIYIRNLCRNLWVNLDNFSAKVRDIPVTVFQKEFQIPIAINPNRNKDAISCQGYEDTGAKPPKVDFFFIDEASRFELQNLDEKPVYYWGYRWGEEPVFVDQKGVRVLNTKRYQWYANSDWIQMRLKKVGEGNAIDEPLQIYLKDEDGREWTMEGTVRSSVEGVRLSTFVTIHDLWPKKWSK